MVKNNRILIWGALACGVVAVAALVAASILFALEDGSNGRGGMMGGQGMMDSGGGMMGGGTGDIDRHFIEQMIPHHQDAVDMADLAIGKAQHPELKALAENIKRDQTREIEQMRDWYRSWYGDDPSNANDSGMMGGGMMGMMHDDVDLQDLSDSDDFDKEFIEQMIPHHEMAIMMARMLEMRSDRPEMQELARTIIRTQSNEIDQMRSWYEDW
jgi:uncharacterized protein (DUF305 family)